MKKGIYEFTALVMALSLVGCGSDKNKTSDKESKSSKTTVSSDENKESSTSGKSSLDIKNYAGEYVMTSYGTEDDGYPDVFDIEDIADTLENDPMTISEDGTLHFCGKDYKLVTEKVFDKFDKEENVYSVEGSGFDFDKYYKSKRMSIKCVDKDYEGVAYFTASESQSKFDEDTVFKSFTLHITAKGDEKCALSLSFDSKEDFDKQGARVVFNKTKSADKIPDIKDYAGKYMLKSYNGCDLYDAFDVKTISDALANDPMSISEDGTLHFYGNDYKLVPEGSYSLSNIYSAEGSGFNYNTYTESMGFGSSECADNEYEGVAFFEADKEWDKYELYITANGYKSCDLRLSFVPVDSES